MSRTHLQNLAEQTSGDLSSEDLRLRGYAEGVQDAMRALERSDEEDPYSEAFARTVTIDNALDDLRDIERQMDNINQRGAIGTQLDQIILKAEGLRGMVKAYWRRG